MRLDRVAALGCYGLGLLACSRAPTRLEQTSNSKSAPPRTASTSYRRDASAPSDVALPPAQASVTASGVASKVLSAGTGSVHPRENDCVRLRFRSWKRDGSLHAATSPDQPPETQCLRDAMPGLREALELMVAGEARRIWVPGELTYHSHDSAQPAPHDDLTFDLSLLELLAAPETPHDLARPPASARRTGSGLALSVLIPGHGKRQARPSDRMRVRFTGWTRAGAIFETTELSGKPASVTRADLAPGVGEGLSLMQIGEKARLWVPAALAYGDHPRRGLPAGPLTYDLELLGIE